jgi:hypothetical protein
VKEPDLSDALSDAAKGTIADDFLPVLLANSITSTVKSPDCLLSVFCSILVVASVGSPPVCGGTSAVASLVARFLAAK